MKLSFFIRRSYVSSKKIFYLSILFLFLFSVLLNYQTANAQIEEGRPIVILSKPEGTFIGSLDDNFPQLEIPTIDGLYEDGKGIIKNLNALEILFLNVFYNKFNLDPKNQMIILAIPSNNSREIWLHIASILFDKFSVPSLYIHEADSWDDAITPELTPGEKLYWIVGE